MRSHSHQKRKFFAFCGKWKTYFSVWEDLGRTRKFFAFCGKWKTYFSDWEDLGRKSCAVLEEGQGTFLFIPLFFFFWFFSYEYLLEMRSNSHQNGLISIFFENGRHMSLIEQIWGSRQEILCSFRGLAEMSDISLCNWKYQNTLSKPYENKSKELPIEIVIVALEGWNLGNL